MATIRLATAAAIRSFHNLTAALENHPAGLGRLIDKGALEDEVGRFRVWSGNLGALQKGHSSADYRLRDSPLLSSNALKLLQELNENLTESAAVITGVRLPYEQQQRSSESDQEDNDSFFSEDEDSDDSDDGAPKTELEQRFREIVDIIDNLYKLSVRIRLPTIRTRSLRAAAYQPKDPDTGVDILEQYAVFDLQHTKELVAQLRAPYNNKAEDNDFLIERLSKAITLRRRQFKYWRRHRDKLGQSNLIDDEPLAIPAVPQRPVELHRHDTLEVHHSEPVTILPKVPASEKTGKTLLSGTEATHHHQSLDDIVDSKSVTSYATTVRDLSGKGIDLPPPPKAADGEKDFECPYCFVICPARYGRGRPWRTHLLQDLQPYICTYPDCESGDVLFRSRREWSEHEASHRKAWRCPEHPAAVFRSRTGLEEHLRCEHSENFSQRQLESIVKVGETSTVDVREKCPLCLADAHMEGLGDLQNHIAHHLERLASFALPILAGDDDADGGSSTASRGRSVVTGSSQELTDTSSLQSSLPIDNPDETDELQNQSASHVGGLLSAETLGNLPDASEKRMDLLFPSTLHQDESEQGALEETGHEIDEYLAETDAFRSYLQSLPGAESVRFYRRYGLWEGRVTFDTQSSAFDALARFDRTRYPRVELKPPTEKYLTSIRFKIPAAEKAGVSGKPHTPEDAASDSSMHLDYEEDREPHDKRPVLTWSHLPTLRTLYTSGVLLQRDQSYAPNVAYNELISLCQYDITRLQVDCIVNSANQFMKVTGTGDSLNHYLHLAAGPSLLQECKKIGRVAPGAVRLTGGYKLPCRYVIHAARPSYGGAVGGTGKLNVLSECYRGALQLAMDNDITTIAFPCIGSGGCGFPPRVAARIALQEVREFLDSHKNHKFQRIVFCVFNNQDDSAYKDFLPVYFPPTHRDLESAQLLNTDTDHSDLVNQIQSVLNQVDGTFEQIPNFDISVPDFPLSIPDDLTSIGSALQTMMAVLKEGGWEGKLTNSTRADIALSCSALQILLGSLTESLQARNHTEVIRGNKPVPYANLQTATYKEVWDDFNFHLQSSHGTTLSGLLQMCRTFLWTVNSMLAGEAHVSDQLKIQRSRLNRYVTVSRGNHEEGSQGYVDEVMYAREYQRQGSRGRNDTVRIHEIPSLLQLYQSNELEAKPTNAIPSARELSTVCIFREDITRLEVDVLVNSTDPNFFGMGTLDRTVFRKGGPSMSEDCKNFGPCKEGDVKISPGYLLPARYVIHAIPPETHGKHTKNILRKLYRDILFTASNTLKATSIAIPSIGTGALGNPVRDCAALALEEVKRFLETTDASNTIRKIVLCVFGSNDEAIYKGLAPIYFPPLTMDIDKALPQKGSGPASQEDQLRSSSPETTETSIPKRTLFGSIGEAFRNVRFGKLPVKTVSNPVSISSRAPVWGESRAMDRFEDHARRCPTCNLVRSYDSIISLCAEGRAAAEGVLTILYMENETIYAKDFSNTGKLVKVELPSRYRRTRELLALGEKQDKQFIASPTHSFTATTENSEESPPPGVTVYTAEVKVPYVRSEEDAIATVHTWSPETKELMALAKDECNVRISLGRVEIYEMEPETHKLALLLALELGPSTAMIKSGSLGVVLKTKVLPESKIITEDDIVLESRNPKDCESLFQRLKAARKTNMTLANQEESAKNSGVFKCGVPRCLQSEVGFTTLESLREHNRSAHYVEPSTDRYQYASGDGKQREEVWDRLDDFRHHIAENSGEDEQDLIRRSKRDAPPRTIPPDPYTVKREITSIHSWNFVSFEWERLFPGHCTVQIHLDILEIVDLTKGDTLKLRLSTEETEILREPGALDVTLTGVDLDTAETKHIRLGNSTSGASKELYGFLHQAVLMIQGSKAAPPRFPGFSSENQTGDPARTWLVKRVRKWNEENGRWADLFPIVRFACIATIKADQLAIDWDRVKDGPEQDASCLRFTLSSAQTVVASSAGFPDVYLYHTEQDTLNRYVLQCYTSKDAEELYAVMGQAQAAASDIGSQKPPPGHQVASASLPEEVTLVDLPSVPSHEPGHSNADPTTLASEYTGVSDSTSHEGEHAKEAPSSPVEILADAVLLQLKSTPTNAYVQLGLHEDELAAHLGVSINKVRRALRHLEEQGKAWKAADGLTDAHEMIWRATVQNPRQLSRRSSKVERSSIPTDDSFAHGGEAQTQAQPAEEMPDSSTTPADQQHRSNQDVETPPRLESRSRGVVDEAKARTPDPGTRPRRKSLEKQPEDQKEILDRLQQFADDTTRSTSDIPAATASATASLPGEQAADPKAPSEKVYAPSGHGSDLGAEVTGHTTVTNESQDISVPISPPHTTMAQPTVNKQALRETGETIEESEDAFVRYKALHSDELERTDKRARELERSLREKRLRRAARDQEAGSTVNVFDFLPEQQVDHEGRTASMAKGKRKRDGDGDGDESPDPVPRESETVGDEKKKDANPSTEGVHREESEQPVDPAEAKDIWWSRYDY
ncbi:uncharacterized protein EI97DRAFT_436707 [Westerdykella ornata]|uniref:Macro domain-containing protein n=1 Tax=Westerdykella ornata TaxID=318751 RepID=A0A6A6J870_WESOR|nr:uncharacterized protein EI97DRAFT_436707 [Westerdykella ornata]KAF2272780.1 hypothetical protein EI97DRAFT_436707 [Westerdykella ornata]